LFVGQQRGIPNDIDEQNMRDLQARLGFLVILHLPGNVKGTPSTALDDFFARHLADGRFCEQRTRLVAATGRRSHRFAAGRIRLVCGPVAGLGSSPPDENLQTAHRAVATAIDVIFL
jgi:hypothetical protein